MFQTLSEDKLCKYVGSRATIDLWNEFKYEELTINMRQKGDESYSKNLSRIRIGAILNKDIKTLQTRLIKFHSDDIQTRINELCSYIDGLPKDTVCLFLTNHMCKIINEKMLSKIDSEEIDIIADDTYGCNNSLKAKIKKALEDDDKETVARQAGLSRLLKLKVGAKIMLRKNLCVTKGLVNGTIGILSPIKKKYS